MISQEEERERLKQIASEATDYANRHVVGVNAYYEVSYLQMKKLYESIAFLAEAILRRI